MPSDDLPVTTDTWKFRGLEFPAYRKVTIDIEKDGFILWKITVRDARTQYYLSHTYRPTRMWAEKLRRHIFDSLALIWYWEGEKTDGP